MILKIDQSLKKLRRIYLCTHALGCLDIFRLDDAERGRRFDHVWDYWPDRAQVRHRQDLQLRGNHYGWIRKGEADEGMFVLDSNPELVELAREHFGPYCVICRLENDLAQNCPVMGLEFEQVVACQSRWSPNSSRRCGGKDGSGCSRRGTRDR